MFLFCIILTLICLIVTVWVVMAGNILAVVFGVGTLVMAIITYFAWEASHDNY